MKILGIETSCDETAAAVVQDSHELLSNTVATSIDLHQPYGGVVPEIAARSHLEVMPAVIETALSAARSSWSEIDAIAVTYGAGLGGSLLIGVLTARSLALALNKPLYAVNHVTAHVYANFITKSRLKAYQPRPAAPRFPFLAIILSGGHSQLALFYDHFNYRLLGQTQDDAVGEAFDKVAKLVGLPYPGGPAIAELAKNGNPLAFKLPEAKVGRYDFSFSGPKTAVLRLAQSLVGEKPDFPSIKLPERLNLAQKADIAASFEHSAVETVVKKAVLACQEFQPAEVVLAGGVAANQRLRSELKAQLPVNIEFPDPRLCTDNAAMIACLGGFMAKMKRPAADPLRLDIAPSLSM